MQLSWAKPGNPTEGGRRQGRIGEGRGGGEREGERGSRAKPGNQLVYLYTAHLKMTQGCLQ